MAGFSGGKLSLDSQLFTTSSGNNNDVPNTSSLMYVNVSNDLDAITGITPGDLTNGYLILVVNIGPTNNLVLKNNSGASAPESVILTADGQDYVLPPFNTAILGYDTTFQMWHVVRVPDVVHGSSQATPSDPTGTTSGTGVMMGLGASVTPSKTGKVMVIASGNIANGNAGGGAQTQLRYGTGTAPTNGAALTGTAVGGLAKIVNPLIALLVPGSGNFTCNAIVSGLTLGTPVWVDLSLGRTSASGTASITNVSISIIEL